MSKGLYNRKKTVVQLRSCHGLNTADREFLLKRLQTGVSINLGHFIKGNQPLINHTFIEIMNTTKLQRQSKNMLQSV